ncbi:MAG: hypothetical protein IPO07_24135 [Haliscomenobacter sp.]|nr:hypothetical protein [Haliscomenobacter sp.]MBK9491535.1 hypothetical protein [Haliscomenobacter sp.]
MTVTRFKSGKELEEAGKMTWDYITKGMSKEDLGIADNKKPATWLPPAFI